MNTPVQVLEWMCVSLVLGEPQEWVCWAPWELSVLRNHQTVCTVLRSWRSGSYCKSFVPMLHMMRRGPGRQVACSQALDGAGSSAPGVRGDAGWRLSPQALPLEASGLGPSLGTSEPASLLHRDGGTGAGQ